MENRTGSTTYVVAVDFLLTNLFEKVVDLVLSENGVVGEDHLVQSAVVEDDARHVATNVSQVCDGGRGVTVANELIVGRGHGIVDSAGFETGVRELVPPTDIDNGVGQVELLDVVVDGFLLYIPKSGQTLTYDVIFSQTTAGDRDGSE